jgi:hypothetical protein
VPRDIPRHDMIQPRIHADQRGFEKELIQMRWIVLVFGWIRVHPRESAANLFQSGREIQVSSCPGPSACASRLRHPI